MVDKKLVNDVKFVEVDAIPIGESHVATNRDVEKYEHFHGIQLVKLQRKEIGILIGTDCANNFFCSRGAQSKETRTNRLEDALWVVFAWRGWLWFPERSSLQRPCGCTKE